MSRETDYYGILHVRPDAPGEVIRASYRTLMHALRVHPDLGGNNEHAALINQAYRVLSDPLRRAEYDHSRRLRDDGYFGVEQKLDRCLFCAQPGSAEAATTADSVCDRCGSPLARAERHRLERSSRRMLRRTDRVIPVRIATEWPPAAAIEGMMQNLSMNGMRFSTNHEFGANQLIRIDCELLTALARVTHCRDLGRRTWTTGVEFVTILFTRSHGTFISATA